MHTRQPMLIGPGLRAVWIGLLACLNPVDLLPCLADVPIPQRAERTSAHFVPTALPVVAEVNPPLGDALAPPTLDLDKYMRNRRAAGLPDSDVRLHRSDPARGMLGKVSITVIFVESNGTFDANVYNWTTAFEDEVLAKVHSGLNWWVEQATAYGRTLSFNVLTYRHGESRTHQPYEPVLRASTESNYWVAAIMKNLGFSEGDHLERTAAFNDWICKFDNSDLAITMFACCNPKPAATSFTDGTAARSYYGGPYLRFLGRLEATTPLDMTIAHELGHVFHACDEYGYTDSDARTGCTRCDVCDIDKQAYPNPHGAANGNCEYCNSASVLCIMKGFKWTLCDYTRQQVGWSQSAAPDSTNAPSSSAPGGSGCGPGPIGVATSILAVAILPWRRCYLL